MFAPNSTYPPSQTQTIKELNTTQIRQVDTVIQKLSMRQNIGFRSSPDTKIYEILKDIGVYQTIDFEYKETMVHNTEIKDYSDALEMLNDCFKKIHTRQVFGNIHVWSTADNINTLFEAALHIRQQGAVRNLILRPRLSSSQVQIKYFQETQQIYASYLALWGAMVNIKNPVEIKSTQQKSTVKLLLQKTLGINCPIIKINKGLTRICNHLYHILKKMDHKYFKEIETTKIVSRMGRFFDIPIDTAPNPDQTFEQLKVQFWNQNVNKIFPQTLLIAVEQVIGQLPECRTWCNLFDKQLLESAPKRALKLAVRTLEHKDSFYQREAHVALYWLYNLVRPTNLRETILALLDIAELRSLYRVSSSNDEGTPFLQVTTSVLIGGGGNKDIINNNMSALDLKKKALDLKKTKIHKKKNKQTKKKSFFSNNKNSITVFIYKLDTNTSVLKAGEPPLVSLFSPVIIIA